MPDMNYEEIAEAVRGLMKKSEKWRDRIYVERVGDSLEGGELVVIVPREDLEVLKMAATAFTKIIENTKPEDWLLDTDKETKIDA